MLGQPPGLSHGSLLSRKKQISSLVSKERKRFTPSLLSLIFLSPQRARIYHRGKEYTPSLCLICPSRPTKKQLFLKPHTHKQWPSSYSFPSQSNLNAVMAKKTVRYRKISVHLYLSCPTVGKNYLQDDCICSLAVKSNGKCKGYGDLDNSFMKCLWLLGR